MDNEYFLYKIFGRNRISKQENHNEFGSLHYLSEFELVINLFIEISNQTKGDASQCTLING